MSEIIPSTAVERIWKLFTDKGYRRGFYRSQVGGTLAAQIFRLRKNAGLSQTQLATQIGSSQSQVSAWEGSCDSATLASLFKIADAFDVGLVVKFAPFSEIAKEAVSHDLINFLVPSFDLDCPQAASYKVKIPMISASRGQIPLKRIAVSNRYSFAFISSGNPSDAHSDQRRNA